MRFRAAALLLPLVLVGCGQEAGPGTRDGGTVQVAAAFYPLEYVVRAVGGERVQVEGLTPPGAEPHDLELGARQTARVSDADLLVHLDGFQPAVDEAAEQVGERALDVASVVSLTEGYQELDGAHEGEHGDGEHGDGHAQGLDADPHLWLDPVLLAQVGDAVAERLTALDPDGAADYERGAAELRGTLEALDRDVAAGLRTCERREVVVSHNAFGYLASRYGLEQVGISGLSPEEEPSPARIAEAARYAEENGVTTIFFETLVSPAVAETVADEVGAETAVLDPLEGEPEGGDYVSGMRANLDALRSALGCS